MPSSCPSLQPPQTTTFRAILATHPEEMMPALYLCTGRIAPAHEGLELGVGESILLKVGESILLKVGEYVSYLLRV